MGLTLLLAAMAYLDGLDSSGIASNGDENLYIRIARLTAESGHWLPLQIDFPKFRNTKPPLLFWQAIAAADGGDEFTLWRLRLPSVLYTFLTATLIAALAWRFAGRRDTALLAAAVYLAFYNTFRYGRPLLTDPPEIFWLTCTAVGVLLKRPASLTSSFWAPLLIGGGIGISCLYKSFALILPMALILAGWYAELQPRRWAGVTAAIPRLAVTISASAAIFATWFALDPDPAAIWRNFVIGENIGKLGHAGGYLRDAVIGGSSVPNLLLASIANGGVLAPVIVAVLIDGWRHRRTLSPEERWLWLWVLGFFVAFSLPTQRSGRYLLPAMPALALLAAMNWQRLHRAGFIATAALGMGLAALIATLSIELEREVGGDFAFSVPYFASLAAAFALGAVSMARPRAARDAVVTMSVLLLLATGMFVRAYDAPPGPFSAATRAALRGKTLWVPCEFVAAEEGHRFLLPGADIRGYRQDDTLVPADLARRFGYFAVYAPMGAVAGCEGCTLIGSRYLLRGRHAANNWLDTLRDGIIRDLFDRELVFASSQQASASGRVSKLAGCGG